MGFDARISQPGSASYFPTTPTPLSIPAISPWLIPHPSHTSPYPIPMPREESEARPTTRPLHIHPPYPVIPDPDRAEDVEDAHGRMSSCVNPSPSTPSFPTPIGNPSPADVGVGFALSGSSKGRPRNRAGPIFRPVAPFSLVASSLVGALPRCEAAHAEAYSKYERSVALAPPIFHLSLRPPPSPLSFRCPARNLGLAHSRLLPPPPSSLPSTELEA